MGTSGRFFLRVIHGNVSMWHTTSSIVSRKPRLVSSVVPLDRFLFIVWLVTRRPPSPSHVTFRSGCQLGSLCCSIVSNHCSLSQWRLVTSWPWVRCLRHSEGWWLSGHVFWKPLSKSTKICCISGETLKILFIKINRIALSQSCWNFPNHTLWYASNNRIPWL